VGRILARVFPDLTPKSGGQEPEFHPPTRRAKFRISVARRDEKSRPNFSAEQSDSPPRFSPCVRSVRRPRYRPERSACVYEAARRCLSSRAIFPAYLGAKTEHKKHYRTLEAGRDYGLIGDLGPARSCLARRFENVFQRCPDAAAELFAARKNESQNRWPVARRMGPRCCSPATRFPRRNRGAKTNRPTFRRRAGTEFRSPIRGGFLEFRKGAQTGRHDAAGPTGALGHDEALGPPGVLGGH